MHHLPADFTRGALTATGESPNASGAPLRMSLPGRGTTVEGCGVYESPVLTVETEYNEVVLSWNVDHSPLAGFCVEARVGAGGDEHWSPYLRFGDGGQGVPSAERVVHCAQGLIDTDCFHSEQRFDRIQYRILAVGGDNQQPDVVHIERFTICLTDTRGVPAGDTSLPAPTPSTLEKVAPKRLPVPFLSQKSLPPALANHACSPTSVAMVLAYRGVDIPVKALAERIYDPVHHIYGNWPRAVQVAYLSGVPGYLTRFSDWAQVRQTITNDQPLIVSITAEEGELTGAPYAHTTGHLLVLTGFDDTGHVLANDPAAPDAQTGQVAYPLEQLDLVWLLRKGGIAYVLLPSPGHAYDTYTAPADPLVDLAAVDPRLVFDIRYATSHNFTGVPLYSTDRCLLRSSVAQRLRRVQDTLQPQGLGLKVFDGYRSLDAQRKLWAAMPDPRFVSNPARGSRHGRGTAVDITLVDSAGRELDMPTEYDAFAPAAHRDFDGGSVASRENRALLERAMATEGFIGLTTEWWHFDAPDWRSFPPIHSPPPPEPNPNF